MSYEKIIYMDKQKTDRHWEDNAQILYEPLNLQFKLNLSQQISKNNYCYCIKIQISKNFH